MRWPRRRWLWGPALPGELEDRLTGCAAGEEIEHEVDQVVFIDDVRRLAGVADAMHLGDIVTGLAELRPALYGIARCSLILIFLGEVSACRQDGSLRLLPAAASDRLSTRSGTVQQTLPTDGRYRTSTTAAGWDV
ncbi:MAG: hypothetical protein ACRDRO_06325 [Pseudonocardiaceae bacterium]